LQGELTYQQIVRFMKLSEEINTIEELEDSLSDGGSSNADTDDISTETDSARLELIAYDGAFDAKSIRSKLDGGRREAVFFSVENKTDATVDIWSDEWQLVGEDGFMYDYVQKPFREVHDSEYPAHYPKRKKIQLSPQTKTRYLLISALLPESVRIGRIEYKFLVEFHLDLPEDLPNRVGDPPL
jgi:hypothetical protein